MRRKLPQPRRQNRVEQAAWNVLQQLKIDGPPLDVNDLAKQLDVRITNSDLGDDCSGVLVKSGESAVIGVNWEHHSNRQRFTIAHELGHFFLHKNGTYVDRSTSAFFRNSESGSGTLKEEREANQFAAALLMPSEWVYREIGNNNLNLDDDLAVMDLAERFGVSEQAMSFRLANLRLTTL